MPGLVVLVVVMTVFVAILPVVMTVFVAILPVVMTVLATLLLLVAATATAALTTVTRTKARGNLRISIGYRSVGHRLSLLVLRTYAPLPGAS